MSACTAEPPATFSTSRLDMRPLQQGDLSAIHEIWSDPEVIFWGAFAAVEETQAFLDKVAEVRFDDRDRTGWFAVLERVSGTVVGDVVLGPASWDATQPEVGWHVARQHQRRGFATEAAAGLLDHAARIGLTQVVAKILPTNHASRAVASRVGMRVVGRLPHSYAEHELWAKELLDQT